MSRNMPLFVDESNSETPLWPSQVGESGMNSSEVCANIGSKKRHSAGFTPSPVSPFSAALAFSIPSGGVEGTPSDGSEGHPAQFSSRPTSGSEQEPEFAEDINSCDLNKVLADPNQLHTSSPHDSAKREITTAKADRTRSFNFLEEVSNGSETLTDQHKPFSASSTDLPLIPSPISQDLIETSESRPQEPTRTRGPGRISRIIQPLEGPPPTILQKSKGPWHKAEDHALMYWVSHLGTGKWVEIARRVGSRTGKQCRERWTNQLSPEIDHSAFRHDEDLVIIRMQQTLQANKWCEVAKFLPGRPENAIKNRWNSRDLQRKRNELYQMMSGGGPGVLSSQIARADNSANAARSATSSSKRPRSSSGFEAHPQILAGPRPCQYSGDGSKKHRLMVAPTTSQLRNSFTSFQSTNPVGPHSECLPLGQAHSISNNQETRKESLNLRDQEKWGSEWFGYHSRTPPSTSSSANRAHTFQRSQSFAPHLASYYSTPVQSPNCLLESSASNSISSSIASHPKRQSRQLTTSYDEISTPGSVHLVEPPYAQSFYAASTPNDLFNTSLYYSNYETASKPMHFGVGLAGGLNSQGVGVVDDNCTHSVISPSNVQQSNPRIEVEKKQTQPLTYSISHNSDSRLVPSHLDSPVGNTLQSQSSIINSKPGFPLKIRFNSYNSSLGNSGQCMGGSNQVRKGWGFHETESSGIHKRNETEDSASTSNSEVNKSCNASSFNKSLYNF